MGRGCTAGSRCSIGSWSRCAGCGPAPFPGTRTAARWCARASGEPDQRDDNRRLGPPALDELEYFRIKLEAHDVIYAEGVPRETLRTVDESAVNFAEFLRRHGPPRWDGVMCAPLIGSGRRMEGASRLRSAISPWFDCRQKFDVIRDKLEEGETRSGGGTA